MDILDDVFDLTPKANCDQREQLLGTDIDETLEITLNYPLIKKLSEKTEADLKKYYILRFVEIVNFLKDKYNKEMFITQSRYVIEYGKKTHKVHLHGCIMFRSLVPKWSPHGLVSDTVRFALNKIRRKFDESCLFTKYARYQSPPICVDYNFNNRERALKWQNYLSKDIV